MRLNHAQEASKRLLDAMFKNRHLLPVTFNSENASIEILDVSDRLTMKLFWDNLCVVEISTQENSTASVSQIHSGERLDNVDVEIFDRLVEQAYDAVA